MVARADDLDVKYTVYNGKKLLDKEIFNFLEHEIEADDNSPFGIGVKFGTKGLHNDEKLKACAQELSFGERGDIGSRFCGKTNYQIEAELGVCLDMHHFDQWDPLVNVNYYFSGCSVQQASFIKRVKPSWFLR